MDFASWKTSSSSKLGRRFNKGNKPNASAALSEEDIKVLYEKNLLGSSTATKLLNTEWFNFYNRKPFRVTRLQGAQGGSTLNSMKQKLKLVQETILSSYKGMLYDSTQTLSFSPI